MRPTELDLTELDGGCDAGYASTSCLWGVEPEPFVVAIERHGALAGASVLDAGCGEGRNTAWLAGRGALVTAVDVSDLALEHARSLWPGLTSVTWQRADLIRDLPSGPFDVVVCDSVLHWLAGPREAEHVVRGLRERTAPGGVHVLCSFNDRRQEFEHHANPPRLVLPHDAYVAMYEGWDVVEVDDGDIVSSHADTPEPHNHSVTRLIAIRPQDQGTGK